MSQDAETVEVLAERLAEWEAVLPGDKRGPPSPMYHGLVCTVAHNDEGQFAVVTKDGSSVAPETWRAVTRLIAEAPATIRSLSTRLAAAEAREAGLRASMVEYFRLKDILLSSEGSHVFKFEDWREVKLAIDAADKAARAALQPGAPDADTTEPQT